MRSVVSGWPIRWAVPLVVLVLFVTALVWAGAREPFERVEFWLRTADGEKTKALAVMPKGGGPFPVVVYSHSHGKNLLRSGNELRMLAEQGMAAVGFEYDQTNQAGFDAQMVALLERLPRLSWSDTNSMAWAGSSLGANRQLDFLLRHPERQPRVLVRIAGGWRGVKSEGAEVGGRKSEAEGQSAGDRHLTHSSEISPDNPHPPSGHPLPLPQARGEALSPIEAEREGEAKAVGSLQIASSVLLLHGERDEVFPVEEARELAAALEEAGAEVELTVFPGRTHKFGEEFALLVRSAAEFCAGELGAGGLVRVNVRPLLWHWWVPLLAAVVLMTVRWWWSRVHALDQNAAVCRRAATGRWLGIAAGVLAALAVLDTGAHLGLAQLKATPTMAGIARAWVVRPELREDLDWLLEQEGARAQTIGTLVQHVELADLQRGFFGGEMEESVYREFVLSPWIGGDDGRGGDVEDAQSVRWRRVLWEAFYPRIRREVDPRRAAEIVARYLRERMTVRENVNAETTIPEAWASGLTDAKGIEQLHVAALRAVGIAARIGVEGGVEMLVDGAWQGAPQTMTGSVVRD